MTGTTPRIMTIAFLALLSLNAHALPALQLGPGPTGDWSYNSATETWEAFGDPFSLAAYANSDGSLASGDYAWEQSGTSQYAYLIVAAEPHVTAGDAFDVSITNDGSSLSVYNSGFSIPPLNDPNSIAPHGIYNTYFEIYEFNFDGPAGTIGNTQPGDSGTGEGFTEIFEVSVNSLSLGALGLHFDLFTVNGNGKWDPLATSDKKLVEAFAPFSHDAAYVVPVPAAVWLFGTALIGFIGISRRTKV